MRGGCKCQRWAIRDIENAVGYVVNGELMRMKKDGILKQGPFVAKYNSENESIGIQVSYMHKKQKKEN